MELCRYVRSRFGFHDLALLVVLGSIMGGTRSAHALDQTASAAPLAKAASAEKTSGAAPRPQTLDEVSQRLRAALERARAGGAKPDSPAGKADEHSVALAPFQATRRSTSPPVAASPHQLETAQTAKPAKLTKTEKPARRVLSPPGASALPNVAFHDMPASPHADWAYEGEYGPANWAALRPEYSTCGSGRRQSPIHIQDATSLQGPAQALQINYPPIAGGSVVNNGHTIQVDVEGDNTLTVRGAVYRLLQLHFHHPAEEVINDRRAAMVAHLVHKNANGQIAVVAVLLEPGAANSAIDSIWTYMPLDTGDRVPLPSAVLELSRLLPQDQRYYQFMGSLTTPPCTENVLWLVLKQPVSLSRAQIKLFGQLFPYNARPLQALNERPVRDAQ